MDLKYAELEAEAEEALARQAQECEEDTEPSIVGVGKKTVKETLEDLGL